MDPFYLWQALIILDTLIFWLVWMRMLPRKEEAQAILSGSGGGISQDANSWP